MRRIIITAVVLILLVSPGSGATTYLYGEPDLEASVAGANEFDPGSDAEIVVRIQNSGLNVIKVETNLPSSGGELPNTARMVTAALGPGDAPVTVKTDPQMVGEIAGGESLVVPFSIKIASDAAAGTYSLPLQVSYTYLHDTELAEPGTAIYNYRTNAATLSVPMKIRPRIHLRIVEMNTEYLYAGGEGYINLKVENAGYLEGESSVLLISRNDESPVIPVESSVYIGNFAPGETVDARYKLEILDIAQQSTYPLDISVRYLDDRGDTVTSDPITVGIPAGGEIRFEVISPGVTMYRGSTETIHVEYENCGKTAVYSAQARLIASDPFTAVEDSAYLGDLGPGERARAQFILSSDEYATEKQYGLDTEIRYRDALGNSRVTDPTVVQVMVTARSGIEQVLYSPVIMSIIGALLVLVIYYAAFHRKRNNKRSG